MKRISSDDCNVSSSLENQDHFSAHKVVGELMNKIIPNGSICFFGKYTHGTRNGLITLVEMTDYIYADFSEL